MFSSLSNKNQEVCFFRCLFSFINKGFGVLRPVISCPVSRGLLSSDLHFEKKIILSWPPSKFIVIHNFFSLENWFPEGMQNILPGMMSETVVTGMRPWAVYQLRVFAENQLGKSKEGKVLQVSENIVISFHITL